MTVEESLLMLEKTGKIETLGTVNPGMLIDLYNERLTKRKEKDFKNLVGDMNQYYIKLLIDTVTQRQSGVINPIYKPQSVSIA